MEAYSRYQKPTMLTETSHPGKDRPLWIKYITKEVLKVLRNNIPFSGICLYPIVDRPDWDNPDDWHHSGLWDQQLPHDKVSLRILDEPYAEALTESQKAVQELLSFLNAHV